MQGLCELLDAGNEARPYANYCFRITGYTGAPEAAHIGGSTFDCPNLTPSWGAKKTLWLACASSANANAFTAPPADYTDFDDEGYGGHMNGTHCANGRRELLAASEDPGGFAAGTEESTTFRHAATIAVQGK